MAITMLRKIKLIFLVSSLVLTNSVFGQKRIKSFSSDFSSYISELEIFMTSSRNQELKETFRLFKNKVKEENFNKKQQEEIIMISNKMLKKRLNPNPHFNHFLKGVAAVSSIDTSFNKLSQWNDVVLAILENSTAKKLTTFCHFTYDWLNSGNLRYSKNIFWQADYNDFNFHFEVSEPYIQFDKPIELQCITNSGKLSILNTKGNYWPLKNKWDGVEGVVNWNKHSISKDSIYANLSNYHLDFRTSKLIADSVIFYNKYRFNTPILGQLIDKVVSGNQAETFPRFTSYSKKISINDILPNVDYKGGYKLIGNNFVADGGKYSEANIIFKRDGVPVFIANASRFNISDNKIASKDAKVRIFFDNDSIYHSNLKFTYFNDQRLLRLIRDRRGIGGSPIINTYHNLNMDFELLEWKIDDDFIKFGSLPNTAISNASFESKDLYLEERFNELEGIDEVHPLYLIDKYIRLKDEDRFFVSDFAKFTGYPINQIERYLLNLAAKGFIFYDIGEERITVQESLYRYIKAKSKEGDYDVVSFNSRISSGIQTSMTQNAALDLRSKDLMIAGIPSIQLSSVQNVVFIPNQGRIVVKRNRDFIFSGKISTGSGRFNLFGRNFHFHYDKFSVDLNNIDSVQLYVPVSPVRKDMYGNDILTKAKTVIEAVTGELRIDHPSNKSGLRTDSFPEFPIFRSFDKSFVYYDHPSIYKGVYKRDNFSFLLDTFQIDSLDNYTGEGLAFPGTFQSGGIFPIFNDTLRLQDDYSLGFNRATPGEGFDIYTGKAKYFYNIHLSHRGLLGSGKFNYLNSSSTSDDIVFFPDSLNMKTNSFVIKEVQEGIEFPAVRNKTTYVHFEPYMDKLYANQIDSAFNLYNNQAIFSGNLLMQPIGLEGSGLMKLDKAELSSSLFTYNASWFNADTANLKVFEDQGTIAIHANNLRSYVDLKDRIGIFNSNGSNSFIDLSANKYRCYIDQLTWEMDNQQITLGAQDESALLGTKFVSLHPKQDSLNFITQSASYNLSDNIVYCSGVEYIDVADAIIYPDSGNIVIGRNAKMDKIKPAKIIADNLTEHHKFIGAQVEIEGANQYLANGKYIYINSDGIEQEIFFNEIKVNKDTITVANATVLDSVNFKINNRYDFKGKIELIANKKDLTFNGYFRINHKCNLIEKEWISFKSLINPDNIVFNLSKKIYNDQKNRIHTGISLSLDSLDLYSSFFNTKDREIDHTILDANYSLRYNQNDSSYLVGGPDSLSNYFKLFDRSCITTAEGKIDLGLDLGRITVNTFGDINHNLKDKNLTIEGFLLLDFYFSEKVLEKMYDDIYSSPGEEFYDYDAKYVSNLSRVVKGKNVDRLVVDLEMKDQFSKFPKEMNYTLAFTDVKFTWDKGHNAYIAKGPIGLGNISKNQINGILEGVILLENGRNSDLLTIYLQTEFGEIYYFHYKNGVMQAYSTNEEFMTTLSEVKDGKRKAPQERGKKPYRYQMAKERAVENFYNRIEKEFK